MNGVGEMAMVGVAPAITNAIVHITNAYRRYLSRRTTCFEHYFRFDPRDQFDAWTARRHVLRGRYLSVGMHGYHDQVPDCLLSATARCSRTLRCALPIDGDPVGSQSGQQACPNEADWNGPDTGGMPRSCVAAPCARAEAHAHRRDQLDSFPRANTGCRNGGSDPA